MRVIPHVDWIRQDFHAMQMLQSGNDFKFWAPRMSNGHSDGCCAAALCKRAASFGGNTWTFTPETVDQSPAVSAPAGAMLGMRDDFTSRRLD